MTVLAYAGSFSAYTYVAPLLLDTTGVDVRAVGMYMLAYGLFAAIGNALGGRLTDSLAQRASENVAASARRPWACAPSLAILTAQHAKFLVSTDWLNRT